ncbi:MAG: diguanylate cyclase [Thermoanaerobaculia bacterium]|nr:diguanylate cyclase [Thermoanaerobaculia bacterium]
MTRISCVGPWWLSLSLVLMAALAVPAEGQRILRFEHLTVVDGLPDDTVNSLAQDGTGFVWIATPDGLARYDGYTVRRYVHDSDDPFSLPHDDVRTLAVDPEGRLWLGTRGGGLARYDEELDRFTVWRRREGDPTAMPSDYVSSLAFDGAGGLWIGTRTDAMVFMDLATESFVAYPPDDEAPGAVRGSRIGDVLVTRDGQVWVGGMGHGLYRFDKEAARFEQFLPIEGDPTSLPDPRVTLLMEDDDGRVWVGTRGGLLRLDTKTGHGRRFETGKSAGQGLAPNSIGGIVSDGEGGLWLSLPGTGLQHFDPERGTGQLFRHQPTRRDSLATDGTSRLLMDRTGVLWVGTDAGVDRHDPATQPFESYRADPEHPEVLPGDDFWGVGETRDGSLWLAVDEGGVVRYHPTQGTWKQYRHDPEDPHSLGSDETFCLLVDSSDRVWVGTADAGLQLYDPEIDGWIHYRHDPGDSESLSRDLVYSLTEGSDGRLWIGLNRGFDLFDPVTGTASHPAAIEDDPDGGMMASTFDVVEDSEGGVWAATFLNGLYRLDRETREFVPFRPDPEIPDSLGSMRINALLIDRQGTLWAGTNVGLFRHLREGNHWQLYGRKQGFGNANVSALVEGPDGNLWVGTSHGLHRLDPKSGRVRTFLAEDGLPNSEIAWHSLSVLRDERLFIGTAAGFALLDLDDLEVFGDPPVVVLTGLELFNDPVLIARPEDPTVGDAAGDDLGDARSARLNDRREDRTVLLDRALHLTSQITLNHRQSVLTLEFAALDYHRPESIRYAYQLEGWDDDWLETDARRRFATYTNLPAGDYRFLVRAARPGGQWSEPGPGLVLNVLPPPWRTWWAYTLYTAAGLSLLWGLIWSLQRRTEQQRQRAEREEAINEQLRRVDKLKDEFLANTSHELRTPLHGIIGIAESLIDGATGELPEPTDRNLAMIVSSGRRLGTLIDDLLDFSKLQHETLRLQPRPVDLRALTDLVLSLQRPLVGDRDLILVHQIPTELPLAFADEARVEQILHNLVGNAIKFTPSGSVEVSAEECDGRLAITVADTGIGIDASDQELIFASFEQVEGDDTRTYAGTGLGLAISRQLVERHGGDLTVESVPGEGSRFTFTLPVASPDEIAAAGEVGSVDVGGDSAGVSVSRVQSSAPPLIEYNGPVAPVGDGNKRFTVLVVDDEPVNRQVLVNQLAMHDYRIVEATGGEEALAAFEENAPDLVLLDIMMPRMSGYDVCRQLRLRYQPADMPVIYLSAKNQVPDLVAGFESGANDYLTKPITKAELLARVRTHLEILDVHRNLEQRVRERTEDLHVAHLELERLASLDGLTRIANRRIFEESLTRAWADHQRRGSELSVILLDIDYFKYYNDHYGHQAGDEALRAVAAALSGALKRTTDLPARYGGEEFGVVLPDTSSAGAAAIAAAIRQAVLELRIPHEQSQVDEFVSISVGVASLIPRPQQSSADLVRRADLALYRAKEAGRNRVEVSKAEDEGL